MKGDVMFLLKWTGLGIGVLFFGSLAFVAAARLAFDFVARLNYRYSWMLMADEWQLAFGVFVIGGGIAVGLIALAFRMARKTLG